MRCEWQVKKLSDIVEFNPTERLPKGAIAKKISMDMLQPFTKDIFQYELQPYNGGAKFRNGDTIMARITPCLENGKVSKVNILTQGEVGFGSTEYIVLRAIPNVSDPDFIYYLTISDLVRAPAIKSMVGSSGRQRVQQNVLETLELPIPPYANSYENSRKRHELVSTYDYIEQPKSSGYRSLHRVYKYHSDSVDIYNKNMLIEIQFRTHLQHLWATAVETMGLFTKEAIKAGQGDDDVKRFFLLTSALFAKRENQPIPPDVIDDIDEIVSELEGINAKNNYLDFLSGIRVAIDFQAKKIKYKKASYFILILNYNTKRLSIKSFMPSQIDEANSIYNSIESTQAETKIDAVLVNVSSFKSLKSAYPNYFSDIGEFVDVVKSYLKS